MFFLSSDRQVKRMGVAAALTFGLALAAHATSLISLEITSNDYTPEAGAAGLFTDDPGNAYDVDIDFLPATIAPLTFNDVGDSFTFKFGDLNVASGVAIVEGIDAPDAGAGVFLLPSTLNTTFSTTVNAERFDGQGLGNAALSMGDAAGALGTPDEDFGMFHIFGQATLGSGSTVMTYNFANGVTAKIEFVVSTPGNVGNGLGPSNDQLQMTATLTDYMIPEPTTYMLFGLSLGILALMRRKRA